jgi:hypothetical protein
MDMEDRLEEIRKFYEAALFERFVKAGVPEYSARAEAERMSKRLKATEKID